jgi:hypothetical protein
MAACGQTADLKKSDEGKVRVGFLKNRCIEIFEITSGPKRDFRREFTREMVGVDARFSRVAAFSREQFLAKSRGMR